MKIFLVSSCVTIILGVFLFFRVAFRCPLRTLLSTPRYFLAIFSICPLSLFVLPYRSYAATVRRWTRRGSNRIFAGAFASSSSNYTTDLVAMTARHPPQSLASAVGPINLICKKSHSTTYAALQLHVSISSVSTSTMALPGSVDHNYRCPESEDV